VQASGRRIFWTAWISTVVAMVVEHFVWFLSRSQGLNHALGYLTVPLLMGLVAGLVAGVAAVAIARLGRGIPAVFRHPLVAVGAAVGAIVGTLPFPTLFLYKWFTVPLIAAVVVCGMLLFARDRMRSDSAPTTKGRPEGRPFGDAVS
jgi:hypothetical protein